MVNISKCVNQNGVDSLEGGLCLAVDVVKLR